VVQKVSQGVALKVKKSKTRQGIRQKEKRLGLLGKPEKRELKNKEVDMVLQQLKMRRAARQSK